MRQSSESMPAKAKEKTPLKNINSGSPKGAASEARQRYNLRSNLREDTVVREKDHHQPLQDRDRSKKKSVRKSATHKTVPEADSRVIFTLVFGFMNSIGC